MPNVLGAALFFSILSVATVVLGAEFKLHPSLAVSEEYTDNVFLTTTNRTSDYITSARPGLSASYIAPALNGDLSYVFNYRHYAKNSVEDEITHELSAKAHLTAVENLMYLDVSDEYQRVSLDPTRTFTTESLFLNQTDRNVVTASPYFTLRPTERISVKPGYRFIDTRYFGPLGFNKTDHSAFLNTAYELTKKWSLTADYTFTRETAEIGNFSQHQALGGFRYEYADKSFLFAQAGDTWIKYDGRRSLKTFSWNAGFAHVFDTVTASISTGVSYIEDPLSNVIQESFVRGTLEKRFPKGTLSLSPYYSAYSIAETDASQSKKYGATVQGTFEILSDLNVRLAITEEKYELTLFGSNTWRFQVDSGLSYPLAKQLTAYLSYIYVGYNSPGSATDNRNVGFSPGFVTGNVHVNRGMIEIKKTF